MRWLAMLAVIGTALALSAGGAASTGASAQTARVGQASPSVLVAQDPTLGAILTDPNGMTLYTHAGDSSGNDACAPACLGPWPAFQPPSSVLTAPDGVMGALDAFSLADGTQQVEYNGMPLYYFVRDQNPGDVNGQGVNAFGGVWSVAMP